MKFGESRIVVITRANHHAEMSARRTTADVPTPTDWRQAALYGAAAPLLLYKALRCTNPHARGDGAPRSHAAS